MQISSIILPWYVYQYTILIISGTIWIRRRLRDSEYTGLNLIGAAILLSIYNWSFYLTLPLSLILSIILPILGITYLDAVTTLVLCGIWVTLPFIIDEARRGREIHVIEDVFE